MTLGIHNYAEIVAAVICTICILYKPSAINRWFIWFLWLTICVEFTGKMTVNLPSFKLPMYNVFTGVEFIFYSLFFIKIAINKFIIRIVQLSLGGFIIFWIINFIFFQKPLIYNTYTATFSGVLLCFFSLLYFYTIIIFDDESQNKWSKLIIVSGIFIFYAGSFNIYSSFNLLIKKLPKELSDVYNLIINNLNVILYGFFIIAFVIELLENRKAWHSINNAINDSLVPK